MKRKSFKTGQYWLNADGITLYHVDKITKDNKHLPISVQYNWYSLTYSHDVNTLVTHIDNFHHMTLTSLLISEAKAKMLINLWASPSIDGYDKGDYWANN
jgi:hypothetical protein